MDNKYLTVAEFAELVHLSKQAIYKRIDKDLSPYCKHINGVICINVSARALFINDKGNDIENISQDISYLLSQLEEKDKIISSQQKIILEQTEQIKNLQNHILSQSVATTEILQKQSQLQENFQILLGQQQKLIQESSQDKQEETIEQLNDKHKVESEENTTVTKKKGFFSKFFD